jgi:hypothetical protein
MVSEGLCSSWLQQQTPASQWEVQLLQAQQQVDSA